jgi:undecaprenyl diphosphate synthase
MCHISMLPSPSLARLLLESARELKPPPFCAKRNAVFGITVSVLGERHMTSIDMSRLPRHIAIIMDGNGRWAKKQGLRRIDGHRKGADAARETIRTCRELGIPILTLFAFSSENWARPEEEVNALMELMRDYIFSEQEELLENGVRVMAIGDVEKIPKHVRTPLEEVIRRSASRDKMTLCVALSYGGRDEIVRAVRRLATQCVSGGLRPEEIDSRTFERELWTAGLDDPDLLIRTSGEMRLSNFLLWQSAYAEIVISNTLWPDFDKADLLSAIATYQQRERRFGLTSEQVR